MKRIGIIHKMRGVAALMVFSFHLVYLSDNFFNFFGIKDIFLFGRNGIHVFFVISGFVIMHSLIEGNYDLRKWKSFVLKRLIRLEPPYLVVLLLTFAYLLIRSFFKGPDKDTPNFSQLLLHVGYLIPFTKEKWLSIVFWSLAVEFQFYFLISFVYPLLVKFFVTRWIVFVVFWALQFLFPSVEFFYWSLVFAPGIQLALYRHNLISKAEFIFSFFILPLIILLNYDVEVFSFSFVAFLLIFFGRDFKSAAFNFFGNISYSLYLVHMLIFVPLLNIGIRYFHSDPGRIIMLVTVITAVIISAYLLYLFVEKPSKTYAGLIKYTDNITYDKIIQKNV